MCKYHTFLNIIQKKLKKKVLEKVNSNKYNIPVQVMNCQVLLLTLNSISSDSGKNNTLKSVISLVQNIEWSDISEIISCYSSDSSKNDAVKIIVSKKIDEYVYPYLSAIVDTFYSDSGKITVLKTLQKFISDICDSTLVDILNGISSDSSKVDAISIITPYINRIHGSHIPSIISSITSDSSKTKSLNFIMKKVESMTGSDALSIIQNISSDSSKVKCVELLEPKIMKMVFDDILSILNNISSDSSTLATLKIFVRAGLKVNVDELIRLFETCSSNSTKTDIVLAFDKLTEPISNHESFCKTLAISIDDPDYYLKAAKKLNLDEDNVQKYKPEKKNFRMNFGCDAGIDFGSEANCISEYRTISNGVTSLTKTYSNGENI